MIEWFQKGNVLKKAQTSVLLYLLQLVDPRVKIGRPWPGTQLISVNERMPSRGTYDNQEKSWEESYEVKQGQRQNPGHIKEEQWYWGWGLSEAEAWLKVICRSLGRHCVNVSQQCALTAKMANNILGQKQPVDWAKRMLPSTQHSSDHAENTVHIFGYPRHKEVIDKLQEMNQRPSRWPEELPYEKRLKAHVSAWRRICLCRSQMQIPVSMRNISRKWRHTMVWDRKMRHSINWNRKACGWIEV